MTVSAFAADIPATEDLLGFTPHAQRLAATILKDLPKDHSFVIGIEGEWGEGKSSFINFLKNRLNAPEIGEVQPAIVEFNPWWYEGSNKLLSHLLETLIHQLNAMEALDKEFKQALIQFFKALDGAAPVIEKTSKTWLPLLGFVGTGAAVAEFQWLGAVLGVLVSVLAKLGLDYFQKTPSLEDLRCKLVSKPGYLIHANQKVVVIIDDLDRLPRDEIQQLFRVIKGVLNLPNIVYVIAYDRKIVASALSDFHKDRGEAYLEKIIQLPYRLPAPESTCWHSFMVERLRQVDCVRRVEEEDSEDVQRGLMNIAAGFLSTPRDIKRLQCALMLSDHIPGLIGLNPLDFVFLEAMRLKNLRLWQAVIDAWRQAAYYNLEYAQKHDDATMGGKNVDAKTKLWLDVYFPEGVFLIAERVAIQYFTNWPLVEQQPIGREVQTRSDNSLLDMGSSWPDYSKMPSGMRLVQLADRYLQYASQKDS